MPRWPERTRFERALSHLDIGLCWEWTGSLNKGGYGQMRLNKTRLEMAHRVVWEELAGPIPEGLDLDHLCRNRKCANPDHLEPVTRSVNLRRGRAGKHGNQSKGWDTRRLRRAS